MQKDFNRLVEVFFYIICNDFADTLSPTANSMFQRSVYFYCEQKSSEKQIKTSKPYGLEVFILVEVNGLEPLTLCL